jgi:DNA-binding HxlR family transcriptional regulator
MKEHYGCPVQATINVISGKWKVQILWHLSFRNLRIAELRKRVRGISEKVLADQLRQLESSGIISRAVKKTSPPQVVTYSLTPTANDLVPMMSDLCGWGAKYLGVPPNMPRHPADKRYARAASVSR